MSSALPDIPGDWTDCEITIGPHTFRLTQPAAPDEFLEDPEVEAANIRDDYMPYWAYLWPAAEFLANCITQHDWSADQRALEIGAGIGVTGLVGLACGLDITFSDYEPKAVTLALHNAKQNGYEAQGVTLDWRTPLAETWPIIFASDVLYEERNHEPILNLLDIMLEPGGTCWIGDSGRLHSPRFLQNAQERDWKVQIFSETGEPMSRIVIGKLQLILVTR